MGHTVYPMRWIVYDKLEGLRRLCMGLREPERSAAHGLLSHVYQNISAITYANPLPQDIEGNMIFTMLLQQKLKKAADIEELTLLLFSIMVLHRAGRLGCLDGLKQRGLASSGHGKRHKDSLGSGQEGAALW